MDREILKVKAAIHIAVRLLVVGVHLVVGPDAPKPVEVDSRSGLDIATIPIRNVVVCIARLMGQGLVKLEAAIHMDVQLMAVGVHTRDGPVAQLLVGEVNVAERGFVTTHRQLMEGANARQTDQVTLTE